jgi:predicted amidohydrolase
MVRVALLQLNVTDEPSNNLPQTLDMVRDAAQAGATMVFTPEVTNCVSGSRSHQSRVLMHQADDITLAALRDAARDLNIWINIGSLALKSDTTDDARFHNRSFVIDPLGNIVAQYDKIHMFDVTLSDTESYRESAGYQQGSQAVVVDTDHMTLGLSVCYDLRFAYLYRALAQAGAQVLTVPAAFAQTTGRAHWDILLRARAIETGCFVVAAAQCGTHQTSAGAARHTYGHSMVVAPWGDVLGQLNDHKDILCVDLDLSDVDKARRRVPSVNATQPFQGPERIGR